MCDFRGVWIRIFAVSASSQHIFQRIGTRFHTELKLSNIHETRNTNRILGMCKFQFRFRLVHCGTIMPTILYRFSPNFARDSEMWWLRAYCLWDKPEVILCGFRFRYFSGSGDHIFQQICTKSQIPYADKIQQCRLCIQWWMKPEIEIRF